MSDDKTTQLAEVEYLEDKVSTSIIPEGLREQVDLMLKRVRRMARQGYGSEEYEHTARYVDWLLRIPWNKYTKDNIDLAATKQILDKNHYGSEHVKRTMLEYMSVLKLRQIRQDNTSATRAPLLCFVGPQGTGKTTIAKSIAQSMGRSFFRISLGGISSASEIRGVPKGEENSGPGQIIKTLARTGSMNPVILLDELDKTSGNRAAMQDFMAILLEVLDPQQNTTFRDLYIDHPIDLSQVLFICTANTLETITTALLDRLEIVEFSDYTFEEKLTIARSYLFPKAVKYAALTDNDARISDGAWRIIVERLGKQAGVRSLERGLERLMRKVAYLMVAESQSNVNIDENNINNLINDEPVALQKRTAANAEPKKEEDVVNYTQVGPAKLSVMSPPPVAAGPKETLTLESKLEPVNTPSVSTQATLVSTNIAEVADVAVDASQDIGANSVSVAPPMTNNVPVSPQIVIPPVPKELPIVENTVSVPVSLSSTGALPAGSTVQPSQITSGIDKMTLPPLPPVPPLA